MRDTISKIKNWFVENYWLTIILLVTVFLRMYHVDNQSFWLDEVLSMNDTSPNMDFKGFYDSVLLWEAFPHLYFFLLKYFMVLFGYGTMQARIFSAIIGIFGVYAIYLLGRELRNKRTGLIAAAITCVSIYQITYSQEVRPYGMLFLFTALSFYRMIMFLKKPNSKNAIYYGIFSGLMLNSHFFALLTLFSQFIIVMFFISKTPKSLRPSFLKNSAKAAGVTILLMLPAYQPLLRIMKIKSFWIPKPNQDSFTIMFKEFFGNSEFLVFIINILIIYYLIKVLKQKTKDKTATGIIENNVIFSFIILFTWLIVSLVIPLIKSYTDVSMILARYFINIVPIFIIAIALSLDLIKTKIIKHMIFIAILIFSLTDIFVVKDYYNTPSKCQMREMTNEIKARNDGDTKLVVFYDWVFPFFFKDRPDIHIEGKSFEEYIDGMRKNTIEQNDFWYANVNPYNLRPEDEEYLKQNFIQQDKIEYFDAWAYHYVSKNKGKINLDNNLDLKIFNRVTFDSNGGITLSENTNSVSSFIDLAKGSYELQINGNSFPSPAINNENAHIKIKLNGDEIANFYLSDNLSNPLTKIQFSNLNYERVRFQIIYDNDIKEKGKDRSAIIRSIKLKKNK